MTITEVSRSFDVSTRTLRYYEQIGLISSIKREDYAYRTYNEETIKRLRQIIVLRKLRIPLKQIKIILDNINKTEILEIMQQNIYNLNEEINSLITIRDVLQTLVNKISTNVNFDVKLDSLNDNEILSLIEPLSISKIKLKEGKTMNDIYIASERINKLDDKDVRIVYLPPSYVASIHCLGDTPEYESGSLLHEFIRKTKLYEVKPDFRHYGFNNPKGKEHGYERWVTIPDDFDVKPPFVKKKFEGGLYCAYMIYMGNFDEWSRLYQWAIDNEKYELDKSIKPSCLEEHLNYINKFMGSPEDSSIQLDLLLPIKEKV